MKPPRVSIAGLMVLVGFAAANFAAARAFGLWTGLDDNAYWGIFAPFEITLLFALRRLARGRGPSRMFWGGFLVLGSMSLASFVYWEIDPLSDYPASRLWDAYCDLANNGIEWAMSQANLPPYGSDPVTELVLFGVVVYLPQLAVALAGGLAFWSISKVAMRRRGSVAAGEGVPDRPSAPPGSCWRTRTRDDGQADRVR